MRINFINIDAIRANDQSSFLKELNRLNKAGEDKFFVYTHRAEFSQEEIMFLYDDAQGYLEGGLIVDQLSSIPKDVSLSELLTRVKVKIPIEGSVIQISAQEFHPQNMTSSINIHSSKYTIEQNNDQVATEEVVLESYPNDLLTYLRNYKINPITALWINHKKLILIFSAMLVVFLVVAPILSLALPEGLMMGAAHFSPWALGGLSACITGAIGFVIWGATACCRWMTENAGPLIGQTYELISLKEEREGYYSDFPSTAIPMASVSALQDLGEIVEPVVTNSSGDTTMTVRKEEDHSTTLNF